MTNVAVISITLCINGHAFAEVQKDNNKLTNPYPSDNNKYDGDILKLLVDVPNFKKVGDPKASNIIAPKGTEITVTKDDGTTLSVRVKSLSDTKEVQFINENTQYLIDKADLQQYSFKRKGITFGGLIVPFKFYLGSDKKITSSSTVAPYIGYSNSSFYGLTMTPIVSAGLGLVPITNSTTKSTETKAALSTAIGLVVTSSKSESFNAGVLIGKDFLGEIDRKNDPSVGKLWMSFYVGYAL